MSQSIEDMIYEEERKLNSISSSSEIINKLCNIIQLKSTNNISTGIYLQAKQFIDNYIIVIKSADYGYDNFNFDKISTVLSSMSLEEQRAIINYFNSQIADNLPEYDRDWFIQKKHSIEICIIWDKQDYLNFYRLPTLYSGLKTKNLFISVVILIFLVYIVLLPAPFESLEQFEIKYEDYSDTFLVNHGLNILALLADIDNDFKVKPLSIFSTLIIIASKVLFVILIANFLYTKISDKIISK